MNKLAILAVDDEKIILDSLLRQFEINFGTKYIFETAESAEEAFELIDELLDQGVKIILIISDYQMPGMRGDEFAFHLRDKLPGMQVILLTGQITEKLALEFKDKNIFFNVITKPWDEQDLTRIIRNILNNVE